jgi:toxin secretion/phage lysis holin
MHEDTWVKAALAAVGGAFAYVYGPLDTLLIVLLCFVVMDYISGVILAAINHKLSSEIGFRGLARKVMVFVLVGIAALLDRALPDLNGALRAAVCLFYIANEGLSILENAHCIGIPIPKALKTALKKMCEEKEKNREV